MPTFGPISRRLLIRNFRELGFEGPYGDGNHQFMVREQLRIVILNLRQGDISAALLARILRQANISREEWEQL